MRIGRFADPEGAAFRALIDPAAEALRRIGGDITEWATAAATEDTDALRLSDPQPTDGYRPLAPVDPGARVFGRGPRRHGNRALLGFTIGNDVSARDAKGLGGLDLFSMKCLDGASPVEPWIVTPGELGVTRQPQRGISLRVNGEVRQADNTRAMVWSVEEILAYVDERVQPRCGDIVFTGTTCGVGLEFLQPNDVVEAEIEGIGVLRNTVGKRHAS